MVYYFDNHRCCSNYKYGLAIFIIAPSTNISLDNGVSKHTNINTIKVYLVLLYNDYKFTSSNTNKMH